MAFVIPSFPLLCNVWRGNLPPPNPPALTGVECQLRAPSASFIGTVQPSASVNQFMCVLLPAHTDVRDAFCQPISSEDYLEVPAGSGRIYKVRLVDDIAKGFSNEHRFAVLYKTPGVPWPSPIP